MEKCFVLFFNLGGGEIFIILLIVLLLFGSKKIPELAKGLGKGIRYFKDATDDVQREIKDSMKEIKKDVGVDNLNLKELIKPQVSSSKTQAASSKPKVSSSKPQDTSSKPQVPSFKPKVSSPKLKAPDSGHQSQISKPQAPG